MTPLEWWTLHPPVDNWYHFAGYKMHAITGKIVVTA